jgi:hypothetical protein
MADIIDSVDHADIYNAIPCLFCQNDRAVAVKLRLRVLSARENA